MNQSFKEWKRIECLLTGWLEGCKVLLNLPRSTAGGTDETWKDAAHLLIKQLKDINEHIRGYNQSFPNMPHSSAINHYLPLSDSQKPTDYRSHQGIIKALESLAENPNSAGLEQYFLKGYPVVFAFVHQAAYLLENTQEQIHRSVEVAFAHLQRRLVADKYYRKVWDDHENDEIDFEKLGGEHFLLHKIWAFKINAAGERTDLVLQTSFSCNDPLYKSADGLVLTEWKVVTKGNGESEVNEAINQLKLYASGSVYALELAKYRYIVIVSKKRIHDFETEREENGITYRIINIAHNPDTPSVEVRKSKKKEQNSEVIED